MANTHTSETESPLFLKLEAVANRYAELNKQLIDPSVLNQPALIHKLNKERTEIQELTELFYESRVVLRELDEADQILKDPGAEAELQKLAADEARRLQARRREIEGQGLELLAPKDPRDEKNIFVEIRAGTGGEEAALFAGDLFRMYVKYAEKKRLRAEVVEAHETGIGGHTDVVMLGEGKGAYGHFRHESGVHPGPRGPATRARRPLHSSAGTGRTMPRGAGTQAELH